MKREVVDYPAEEDTRTGNEVRGIEEKGGEEEEGEEEGEEEKQ